MKEPVALWHAEHDDFRRLLALLQREVAAFQSGGHPNYELMHEIVEYLVHFPDRLHHPREDAAFRALLKHDPELGKAIAKLEQEHRVLAHAGQRLLGLIEEIQSDAVVARTEVESAAATYLVYYSLHLGREEEDILPAAERLLTPAEWSRIAATVPHDHDPLFGDHAGERFRELRRQISREA